MGNQFDKDVAGKKPKTREARKAPKRPWDVVQAPVEEPVKALRPVHNELRRETVEDLMADAHTIAEEVLVASDDTMMIDTDNLDVFEEIKQLEAQMVSTLSMKTGLEDELDQARSLVHDLTDEADELTARVDTLRTQEELERQLTTVQGQRDSAMDRLSEVESRLESTIASRASAQADLENTRQALDETVEKNSELGEELDQMTDRYRESERELSRTQAENDRLKERVRQMEIVKETQDQNLQVARSAIKNIKQRLAESNVRARLHR